MNNVLDKLPDTSIIGGADGPAAIFFAEDGRAHV